LSESDHELDSSPKEHVAMRVAVVHDFACQRGGAERVVLSLCRILLDPVVVTSLYVPEATYPELSSYEVRSTKLGTAGDATRFRSRALSYPRQFASMDLGDVELVIVSSSAFAHHIRHPRSLVYWHTPPRFLYDPSAYLAQPLLARATKVALSPLRPSDRRAARAHLSHAANSVRTAERLRAAYGIEPRVIHPPLDLDRLRGDLEAPCGPPRALVVSRLLSYKRVDIAIRACALVGIPLTVVGSGPDAGRLRSMARPGAVRFVGSVSDATLAALYATHAVVLSPAIDDFGYVPLEAAYVGRPVVAADAWGSNENVRDGETGRLVRCPDEKAWASAIEKVLATRWQLDVLRAHAVRFGHQFFREHLASWLEEMVDPDEVLRPSAQLLDQSLQVR